LSSIKVRINGLDALVPRGVTVAAAMAIADDIVCRQSVSGEPRAPLCGMGICFECRVTIDGRPHCRACQAEVLDGMEIQSE
jgi:predicted molibdopterin-dependent oxidoreductase YjgC